MSSCCPCLEDDVEEEEHECEEPDEEQPLTDSQIDKQADIYYSKQNKQEKS
jgi:hypothetical protein